MQNIDYRGFLKCNHGLIFDCIIFCLIIAGLHTGVFAQEETVQKKLELKAVPVTEIYEAMGTVRPVTEFEVHSQITAKVGAVEINAGDKVEKGQLLIRLDDREVVSKLEQAKEGLAIARRGVEQNLKSDEELQAEYDQAESDFKRSEKLFKDGINSKKEYDQAKTAYLKMKAQIGLSKQRVLSAQASLRQAEQVVNEAEIYAEYANIRAVNSGIITNRDVDPGDLATPTKTLLTIQTGAALRLEAGIRESLIANIKVGMKLSVKLGTGNLKLVGVVEEIEPYANAKTRSFLIKVGIPVTPGVYPGMFGRLLIPLASRMSIVIPREAVTVVGQLKMVKVMQGETVRKVFVKTGREDKDQIEILSGLEDGDTIVF